MAGSEADREDDLTVGVGARTFSVIAGIVVVALAAVGVAWGVESHVNAQASGIRKIQTHGGDHAGEAFIRQLFRHVSGRGRDPDADPKAGPFPSSVAHRGEMRENPGRLATILTTTTTAATRPTRPWIGQPSCPRPDHG